MHGICWRFTAPNDETKNRSSQLELQALRKYDFRSFESERLLQSVEHFSAFDSAYRKWASSSVVRDLGFSPHGKMHRMCWRFTAPDDETKNRSSQHELQALRKCDLRSFESDRLLQSVEHSSPSDSAYRKCGPALRWCVVWVFRRTARCTGFAGALLHQTMKPRTALLSTNCKP
ncbi:unnamed protein product [Polarella glacialis]|uniref:Uncharacterized protein n=1 Tax=Polarella glacialis TaxID=89957 RepID=A0A813LZP9_POLGL|nr:unnamed protein product [Polarella glacialis]